MKNNIFLGYGNRFMTVGFVGWLGALTGMNEH